MHILNPSTNPPSNFTQQGKSRHGFALIATISVMVLLVMIALAMLSLSSIELRSTRNSEAMKKAQSNARLALMIAIGELQKSSGPDQRVHAEGNMKTAAAGTRSHWLGVYRSWLDTDITRPPEPEFLGWMVSGDPQALALQDAVAAGTTVADEMIMMVGDGSVGNAAPADARVEAGLQKIGNSGGLAWWIGDETMKARIPASKIETTEMVNLRAELMTAPQAGIQRISELSTVSLTDPQIDKAITLSSIDFIADGTLEQHFHDLTTNSMSLITNVRKGGFRKDLSLELEKPEADRPNSPLYTVEGKPGISLGELWDYYNVWRELTYSTSSIPHPDGGSIPSGSPIFEMPPLPTAGEPKEKLNNIEPYYTYKRLTVLRNMWVYSLMSKKSGTSNGEDLYQLYMVLDPIMTVWNPLDVSVHFDPYAHQSFKYWNSPYKAEISIGGNVVFDNEFKKMLGGSRFQWGNTMWTRYGRVEPITLRPGEVQVISQGSTTTVSMGQNENFKMVDVQLGWNFGSGFRYKIRKKSGDKDKRYPSFPGSKEITYTLSPSTRTLNRAVLEFLHYHGSPEIKGSTTERGPQVGSFSIDRKELNVEDPDDLKAEDYPLYFPVIENEGTFTLQDIEDTKRPIMLLSAEIKTESPPAGSSVNAFQGRYMQRFNPKLLGYDIQSMDAASMATTPMQIVVMPLENWMSPFLDGGSTGVGFFGGGYTSGTGSSYVVTHSIPREPIYSLAAFQHAMANGTITRSPGPVPPGEKFLEPSISHAIGNSFAPSFLASNETEGTINESPAADHSYLVNQALWDDWFFSSIAPQTAKSWQDAGINREQNTVFSEFLGIGGADSKPLPNRHMKAWVSDPETVMTDIFQGTAPTSDAAIKVASHLMIEGGFNVNSTSVDAWKLLLSSLRKQKMPAIEPATPNSEIATQAEGVPSGALLTPVGQAIDKNDLDDLKSEMQWRGFRDISDDQIEELAKDMVVQVRNRGPFLSLADFINRRLDPTDKEIAKSGALQAALDDTNSSGSSEPINKAYVEGSRAITEADASTAGLAFPEAEAGASSVGIPGYVKQADLLTSIGPLLTPRSDTFRIRAYGEVRSKDGTHVIARAWCEALVQRTPKYLDPSDEAWKLPAALLSNTNKLFGRRFVITSFRWLAQNEV